jgi:integral membrane protein
MAIDDKGFRNYRVMSLVTGTTLLTLFATLLLHTVDLSLWLKIKIFVDIVGIGHGVVLYPIYMITCFNVVLKNRLNVALLALMFLAGFVPGLAYYLEFRLQRKLYPGIAK